MDRPCVFNEIYSELVMWTLYACLMKYIQSWSRGPSFLTKIFKIGLCLKKYIRNWSMDPL